MQRLWKDPVKLGAVSRALYLRIYFSIFPLSRQPTHGPMQNFALPMQSLHEDKLKESFYIKESPFMQGSHIE
ncbi:hypothetical protein CQZ93_19270 [Ochrobactrum vermis]|nr:hypothetical protein CQZ93_19270 [Ochrobactrum vermis]